MSDQQDIINKVYNLPVGFTVDDVVSNLDLVSKLYSNVTDTKVKAIIRDKVNELIDYLFDNDLAEGVELTRYMLYD
jgi:hypothetical protein